MPDTHRLTAGNPIRIADLPTDGSQFHDDRESAEQTFERLREELADLQLRLYADGRHRLLVVLQAMDAGGKDGTIRHVYRGVNPQGVQVTSFKTPTGEELARDFLWRIHKAVPGNGMIGIFNRSHYEDVLICRVENLVPEPIWRARFEQINQFEKLLVETGTTILKFYLHIGKDEQKKRLDARVQDATKHWKYDIEDMRKRKAWDEYMVAYEDVLNRCTTPWAAWHAIPANQKWYRNLAISRVIVQTLQGLDLRYPSLPREIP